MARISGFTQARAFNRAVEDPAPDAEERVWTRELAERPNDLQRAETIGRAYDGAITRAVRIEAKAVGLLQAVAIGFAIVALVAGRRMWVLQLLSLVAIAYLILATLGALELLKAQAHRQVISAHARDDTGGLLQTALAAVSLERGGPRASNYLTGVLRDLKVGFGAALFALVLIVLGVGDSGTGTGPGPAKSFNLSTTTTMAPSTSRPTTATRATATSPRSTPSSLVS